MRIDILTLFPAMFQGPLTESILQRAQDQKLLDLRFHDLKEFGLGNYHQVDDAPYGGGAGMVMRADVIVPAIEAIVGGGNGKSRLGRLSWLGRLGLKPNQPNKPNPLNKPHRIYLSPRGKRLTQEKIEELSKLPRLLLLCGRYEGIDQRIIDGGYIDEELSIGDYVLTGGELPAMVLIDAVARQIPGVLGKDESSKEESFSPALDRKREYPHYTRPEEFRGQKVPETLLSGNHKEIEKWRKEHLQ